MSRGFEGTPLNLFETQDRMSCELRTLSAGALGRGALLLIPFRLNSSAGMGTIRGRGVKRRNKKPINSKLIFNTSLTALPSITVNPTVNITLLSWPVQVTRSLNLETSTFNHFPLLYILPAQSYAFQPILRSIAFNLRCHFTQEFHPLKVSWTFGENTV
ncbi:hypothetical protein CEXT_648071 [Caerostris extrusa]|uniref:Uncharacterized protein n=1 Tax=Caerostris extrusa TaxID=172846 RepID=A0AAV4XZL8_CAEEX|nr:hypothetical protein CEXT_648071 [Caerostris extrusa]